MNSLTLIVFMLAGVGVFVSMLVVYLEIDGRRDRRYWNERFTVMGQNIVDNIRRADLRMEQLFERMDAARRRDDWKMRKLVVRMERENRVARRKSDEANRRMHADTQILIRMFMERWGLDQSGESDEELERT